MARHRQRGGTRGSRRCRSLPWWGEPGIERSFRRLCRPSKLWWYSGTRSCLYLELGSRMVTAREERDNRSVDEIWMALAKFDRLTHMHRDSLVPFECPLWRDAPQDLSSVQPVQFSGRPRPTAGHPPPQLHHPTQQ